VLLFIGDIGDAKQAQKVKDLANDMDKSESFLTKYGGGRVNQDGWKAFDVITICVGRKEVTNYNDVPLLFRSHWTK
jgi:phenol 2-monooxygenase